MRPSHKGGHEYKRLLPTAFALLCALCTNAPPANHGDVLSCQSVVTGAEANQTLLSNGLLSPNEPDLLVGVYCEPPAPRGCATSPSRSGKRFSQTVMTAADYIETGSNGKVYQTA